MRVVEQTYSRTVTFNEKEKYLVIVPLVRALDGLDLLYTRYEVDWNKNTFTLISHKDEEWELADKMWYRKQLDLEQMNKEEN